MSFFIKSFILLYRALYSLFQVHSDLPDVSLYHGSPISDVTSEYLLRIFILPTKIVAFLDSDGNITICVHSLHRFHCTPHLVIISPRKSLFMHLKWHLSMFSFKCSFLHIFKTLCIIASWSTSLSYPTTNMLSAIQKVLGSSLNISLHISLEHVSCLVSTKW